ncbi:UNVERIFIED_CONTAM: hypothetical protein K2H54_060595 [Gekko kuhli]
MLGGGGLLGDSLTRRSCGPSRGGGEPSQSARLPLRLHRARGARRLQHARQAPAPPAPSGPSSTNSSSGSGSCREPPRDSFSRPVFLQLTAEELQLADDHTGRAVQSPREDRRRLPWSTGYAE